MNKSTSPIVIRWQIEYIKIMYIFYSTVKTTIAKQGNYVIILNDVWRLDVFVL